MKRKSYDKQFKIAAVKLILEEEVPVSVVAKELENKILYLEAENEYLKKLNALVQEEKLVKNKESK